MANKGINVNRYLVPVIIEVKTPEDKMSERGFAKDSILVSAKSGREAEDRLKEWIEDFHIQAVEEFNGDHTPVLVTLKTNIKNYHYVIRIFNPIADPKSLKLAMYLNGKAKFSPAYAN
jgi:hypothetical protein